MGLCPSASCSLTLVSFYSCVDSCLRVRAARAGSEGHLFRSLQHRLLLSIGQLAFLGW